MIAASNTADSKVRLLLGSVFTNALGEGYPQQRWHEGCEVIDEVEEFGNDMCKKAFKASYANLKPHSGSQAVQAVFLATTSVGKARVLSMRMDCGGHMTHAPITEFNKRIGLDIHHYCSDREFNIDYSNLDSIAREIKPDVIVSGASSYPKALDFKAFYEIANKVNALHFADVAHYAGLIAGEVYPSPVPFADICAATSNKTLGGPKGGFLFAGEKCSEELWAKSKRAVNIGLQSEDHSNNIAAKAYTMERATTEKWKAYSLQVVKNTRTLGRVLHEEGQHVVGFDSKSFGTDSHMLLLNVYEKGITGDDAAKALAQCGIYTNKNSLPHDSLPPKKASGLRIATSALTMKGMREKEMELIAVLISKIINLLGRGNLDKKETEKVREEVRKLALNFPDTIF